MRAPKCPWCQDVLSWKQFSKHLWMKHRAVLHLEKSIFGPELVMAYRIDLPSSEKGGRNHPVSVELVEVRSSPASE